MRRAGPLVSIGFEGTSPPDRVLQLLRDREIGGISLFARNFRDAAQARELVRALNAARRVPIAVDQEGGNVVRIGFGTVFPSAMALGATRDAELVERVAGTVARELRALGIGVLLAPVCDVNVEPRNSGIATRAFSDEPELCAELAAAWVRGAQREGVACTAKHFPGHGATALDSHFASPVVQDDLDTVERRDLPPFRAAIDAGVAQVMTAHVRFEALDDRAATYSAAAIGLLRRRLGFEGVVCSDDLVQMAGARIEQGSAAAAAVVAGVDIVHLSQLEPYDEAIDGIEHEIAAGRIPAERCAEALRRAREFAGRYVFDPADEPAPPAHELAAEVARRAITHLGPPLPDLRSGPIVCIAFPFRRPSPVEELRDPLAALERALNARFGERITFVRSGPTSVDVPEGATLVLATSSAWFDDAQAASAKAFANHPRAVLCALRVPYDAILFPRMPALLTYSDVPASCEALAACLAGDFAPRGQAPVRIYHGPWTAH